MTGRERAEYALLLVVSAMLAAVELLYLPLRFDGYLLPNLDWFSFVIPFPGSALLALATMPWLVRRASDLSGSMAVAAGPLGIWLLCIVVSALPGPGGDVVLVADLRALLLLAAGAFAGAVTLGGRAGRGHG